MSVPGMEIELRGAAFAVAGERHAVCDAAERALTVCGGRKVENSHAAEILVCSFPLLPSENTGGADALTRMRAAAGAMKARGGGRVVFILSALAALPARRFPEYSLRMAGFHAAVRLLAMEWAPEVLVNAVGVGTVSANGIVSGDESFLGHVPLGRAGTVDEAVAAVLFFCDPLNTYTSGQLLCVDGGWTAGYGRNF